MRDLFTIHDGGGDGGSLYRAKNIREQQQLMLVVIYIVSVKCCLPMTRTLLSFMLLS